MAGDVLKERPSGPDFADEACNIGPEVARVVLAFAVAREGERLTGITGCDDMNAAAPRSAVKGSQIVPDKSRSQGRVCHPGHEDRRGKTVSLDVANSVISGFSDAQTDIQSSDTGAKTEAAKAFMSGGGTNSHKEGSFALGGHAAWGEGSCWPRTCLWWHRGPPQLVGLRPLDQKLPAPAQGTAAADRVGGFDLIDPEPGEGLADLGHIIDRQDKAALKAT